MMQRQTTSLPTIVILGDWDNTMMASNERLHEIHVLTARELETRGIVLRSPLPLIATKPRDEILSDLFGRENLELVKPVFQKYYDQIFSPQAMDEMKLFNGVRELIAKLSNAKAAKVYFGIISSHYARGPLVIENGVKVRKSDGILDHLERKGIDHSNILVIGVDTLRQHGKDPSTHAKPHVTSGQLALEKWGLDPHKQVIHAVMFGDGKSDIDFGTHMHAYLQSCHPESSCKSVLFNTVLSGEAIFTDIKVEEILRRSVNANQNNTHQVVRGYCGLFPIVGSTLQRNDIAITPEALQQQRNHLKDHRKQHHHLKHQSLFSPSGAGMTMLMLSFLIGKTAQTLGATEATDFDLLLYAMFYAGLEFTVSKISFNNAGFFVAASPYLRQGLNHLKDIVNEDFPLEDICRNGRW